MITENFHQNCKLENLFVPFLWGCREMPHILEFYERNFVASTEEGNKLLKY